MFEAEGIAGTALREEQRVFVECVEDVLASTAGLHYALLPGPEAEGRGPYAVFLIETNPALNLVLSLELDDRSFAVRINGVRYARVRGPATRFEWWVERRCRDVERMVGGDLRVVEHTLLALPVSSTLEAGTDGRWRRIAGHDNGALAFASFLVPYGFLMGREKKRIYRDWFAVPEAG